MTADFMNSRSSAQPIHRRPCAGAPGRAAGGPSGSGKTTTALLIERELDRRGMETHTLSMDDYFCPLTERELSFSAATSWTSSARRASTCRFSRAARQAAGRRGGIGLPHYDFKNSVRVFDGRTLRRRPGELVILEGIHAPEPGGSRAMTAARRASMSASARASPAQRLSAPSVEDPSRPPYAARQHGPWPRPVRDHRHARARRPRRAALYHALQAARPRQHRLVLFPPSSASTARCCGTNWSALPCRSCQMWSRSCGSCRTSRRISCRRIPSCASSSAAARAALLRRNHEKYLVALDQGTTSSRAIVFDRSQQIVASAQKEFPQLYPQAGWVEHDPLGIILQPVRRHDGGHPRGGIDPAEIAAIGITNQRETTILWDRATGRPIYNAIVWQCRRTAALVDRLRPTAWRSISAPPLAWFPTRTSPPPRSSGCSTMCRGPGKGPRAGRFCSARWTPGWSGSSLAGPRPRHRRDERLTHHAL